MDNSASLQPARSLFISRGKSVQTSGATSFDYSYDFGDGWDHRITVEERLPVQEGHNDWPMCLAGENACPPEDVGGPPGYMEFLQAMRDPKHEQHTDYWRWWGGPFDPHAFSINAVNMAIRKLR